MSAEIDRLAKFAEMMLGQLKDAREGAQIAARLRPSEIGSEAMMREMYMAQFARLIQIGEEALGPFRSELSAEISPLAPKIFWD